MIRLISVAAISICIAACASSGPEAPGPAEAAAPAGADAVASDNPSAPPGDAVTQDPDAPVVEMTASASEASDPNEIVCRRERQSGSKMSKRVCRTRAEIDARAEKDKDTLRRSRATQSGSQCALSTDC